MSAHRAQPEKSQQDESALQHARVRELVAAFADGELVREHSREVEEHLDTCATCRRELALQQDIARALSREPTPGASVSLRRRIAWLGEPEPSQSRRWNWRWATAAAAVVAAIFAGTLVVMHRGAPGRPPAEIPLLRDALADCSRVMGRNFPKKADLAALSASVPFPVRTLVRPDAELFSTWKTTLAGAPAAGLAYRWRGIVVVQYAVATEMIGREPEVARALSRGGFYTAVHSAQSVVAVLEAGSGTVVIAEASPEELRRLIL
jgi:hypothetical protein